MRSLLAGIAGAVTAWSFYPGHWWSAVLGVALFLWTVDFQSRKSRIKLALVFAAVFYAFHVQWVSVLGNDAWFGLVLISTFPWLLFAGLPINSKSKYFYFAPAATIVLIEALRVSIPWGGFPWGLIAYSQLDGPLVPLATLGGQGLVTGVVVVVAATLVKFVKYKKFTGLLIPLIILGFANNVESFESRETITLSAVQGNVPRAGLDGDTQRLTVLNNHVKLTKELLTEISAGKVAEPDLIVWPESGTDIDPLRLGISATEISKLVAQTSIPILIGATTWDGTAPGETGAGPRNAGILWSAQAGPGQLYAKNHLVPFGEFIPLRTLLAKYISRFDQIPNDFVAGQAPGVFSIDGNGVGDVICFEVAYANHIKDTVTAGAQVMVVQTNNSTYGNTAQPEQQFAITRFRAIENQRAFLVASTSGISGLISNDGTVLAKTSQFEPALVTGEVALISQKTTSHDFPNWVLYASALIVVMAWRRSCKSPIAFAS
ncbi:MAG: apolipoprotein N-acyltransferase [Actinomycetes bacterium]